MNNKILYSQIKKAQMQTKVISIIIAIFVIVLLALGWWAFSSGSLSFFKFIPNFNETSKNATQLQLLRYDLIQDQLSSYDGTNWIPIKSGQSIILEKKELNENQITTDIITNYYYNRASRKIEKLSLSPNLWQKIYLLADTRYRAFGICAIMISSSSNNFNPENDRDKAILNLIGNDNVQNKGDVILELVQAKDTNCFTKSYGEFIVSSDNKIKLRKIKQDLSSLEESTTEVTDPDLKSALNSLVSTWRDSILKNPVTINYKDTIDNTQKQISACVEKRGVSNLVIDLSKPVEQTKTC
ncbi:MAG: hypothetical protein Q7S74_01730 [Nanoarchaeota archaeon]|nr:hypothetical protein [Nanoarchaeota archaeon]